MQWERKKRFNSAMGVLPLSEVIRVDVVESAPIFALCTSER